MMRERYVLLGLARARADWFRTVGQWATSAALPAEFVRCVSADEVRARLATGRTFSALLVDAAVPGLDRDLVATAAASGCAVLVVDTVEAHRDWRGLGADAVLAPMFSRDELLEVLAATSRPVSAAGTQVRAATPVLPAHPTGCLVAVTGTGGTGASTVAIALAQGLAAEASPGRRRDVLLADLCRAADLAMLHDARALVPGIQEVVEAHRTGVPEPADVRAQTFEVPVRGYRLLLGLRRARHWVTLRPRALEAALDSLTRLADVVVADIEPDVEGEAETGSVDVEDRHAMSRAALERAGVVVVVGEGSMKGCFALVRVLADLLDHGVAADRLLPVLNRAPRNPRQRAEATTAVATLLEAAAGEAATTLAPPLHLPVRRVDQALRDGVPLPQPLPGTLARAVDAMLDRAAPSTPTSAREPEPVVPGRLGLFPDESRP
ncbi:hypothetical protein [Egicoccus sp. AB-alg6-2]|uniref:hypothetical protein n=1 Tax=Egicoccus sp. AB-alg6-2 TaxID=3242692 RepID=UPI00359DFC99